MLGTDHPVRIRNLTGAENIPVSKRHWPQTLKPFIVSYHQCLFFISHNLYINKETAQDQIPQSKNVRPSIFYYMPFIYPIFSQNEGLSVVPTTKEENLIQWTDTKCQFCNFLGKMIARCTPSRPWPAATAADERLSKKRQRRRRQRLLLPPHKTRPYTAALYHSVCRLHVGSFM